MISERAGADGSLEQLQPSSIAVSGRVAPVLVLEGTSPVVEVLVLMGASWPIVVSDPPGSVGVSELAVAVSVVSGTGGAVEVVPVEGRSSVVVPGLVVLPIASPVLVRSALVVELGSTGAVAVVVVSAGAGEQV